MSRTESWKSKISAFYQLLERSGLPELRSLPEQRYWLLQDLQAMLERSALDGPLVISLDDLQ